MSNVTTIRKACGLCNRIKSILSALSIFDEVNTAVYADSYIFPDIKFVNDPINPYPEDWRLKVLPEEEQYIQDFKTIDFLYDRVPQYFIDKYLNIIDNLKINLEILEYIESFIKDWDDVLGVHIRTWYADGPRSLWHNNQLFEDEINKFSNDKKIFLCSDNSETINYFSEKYGNRVITHTQKMHDINPWKISVYDRYQNDVQLIVDAFIDCLILSKCDTIIGTWCSTFTEMAWWYSKCKSKIILPKPLNYDEKINESLFIKK